jgi:plasmid stabilization system protein ParE
LSVRLLPRALAELDRWIARIHADNATAAIAFAAEVFATVEQLSTGAFEGPESTLRAGQIVRSWPVPPVRIYYQRRGDELVVLRIYHQARRPIAR